VNQQILARENTVHKLIPKRYFWSDTDHKIVCWSMLIYVTLSMQRPLLTREL